MRCRSGGWTALLCTVAVATACSGGETAGAAPLRAPVGGSPVRGPDDAWVTIVEFADFQCPYCGSEEPVLASLRATYGDDVRLVFKHFPLDFHENARRAAIAAECAHDQGKFWELHDALFAHGTALDEPHLVEYAQAVEGLDLPTWQACRSTPAPAARVDADRALGVSLGVDATPTFAVNGERVVGAVSPSDLGSHVDRALEKARASGIPRASYYDVAVLGR